MSDEVNTEFEGIVEHLSNPLTVKKAGFVGVCSGLLVLTWLICIIPVAKIVWSAAF